MNYQDEWLLYEAGDDIDEVEHRPPTEEFLFYQAVASGNVEAVRKNCEQGRFVESEGVGVLSRNPVTNLKYHFVITTANGDAPVQAAWNGAGAGIPFE